MALAGVGAGLGVAAGRPNAVDEADARAGALVAQAQPVHGAGDGVLALVRVGRRGDVGVFLALEQLAVVRPAQVERRRVGAVEEVVAQELDRRAKAVYRQVYRRREWGGHVRSCGTVCRHVQRHACCPQHFGREGVKVGRRQRG